MMGIECQFWSVLIDLERSARDVLVVYIGGNKRSTWPTGPVRRLIKAR